jgi:recombination associated protein RdgC
MIFTNAYIFTFIKPFTLTTTELSEFVSTLKFTPLMSTEFSHFGFVSPIKGGLNLVHEANGNLLVCARKEEKLLPAPYVKELLEERIQELELTQPFSATKAQRAEIKDDIELELLPRAFTRKTDTYAYINAKNNTIVINTSSRGKAEDVLSLLRKAIGTLPVKGVELKTDASEVMTSWVINLFKTPFKWHLSNNFSFGLEAHFIGLGDDSATAVVRNQEMNSAEVEVHLEAAQYITKLALNHEESMSFMLHDDLSIKRIKFEGIFEEENYDDDAAKFDGEFILMAGELNNMITDLHSEFGVSATDSLEG